MRISDWSSDVCSSDLPSHRRTVISDTHPETQHAERFICQPQAVDWLRTFHFLTLGKIPMPAHQATILIVGAGFAGSVFARELADEFGRASCSERVCQYVSI